MKSLKRVHMGFVTLAGILFISLFFFLKTQDVKKTSFDQDSKIISGSFDTHRLKPDSEWKKILTPEQYHILREVGTEVPFTGALDHEMLPGTYYSAGCNQAVFRSEQKYDSGTGWPSFWAPIRADSLVLKKDYALGVERIEVLDKCGGHLGHVFDDGPEPTGKRFCMNSGALIFIPDKK